MVLHDLATFSFPSCLSSIFGVDGKRGEEERVEEPALEAELK